MTGALERVREVDWSTFGPHCPMGDTDWRVWSVGMLRSAGFPASGLHLLGGKEAAAAVDGDDFVVAYDRAAAAESAALAALATDETLSRAVVWQNPAAFALLARLATDDPGRGTKRRERERVLAMYWLRYCAKAETIGFFGPAGWFGVGRSDRALTVETGPGLVGDRRVFLERWMVAELADWMVAQPGARWWFPPMLRPDVHLDGEQLLVPGRGPMRLRPDEAAVLALTDGERHAEDLVDRLVADAGWAPATTRDRVEKVLLRWQRQRLLTWDGNIPIDERAERTLRRRVDRIGDPALFVRFDEVLTGFTAARQRVAEATDTAGLRAALDALGALFIEVTGQAATREGGKAYAGRSLCYEDALRDTRMELGRDFLDRIARPLALVAGAADWFGNRLAELVEEEVSAQVRAFAAKSRRPVTLADVWAQVLGLFWGDDPRPVRAAIGELAAKWREVLDLDPDSAGHRIDLTSGELAQRARAVFGTAGPRWPHLAVHSPDLQIVADSVDAVNAGDYQVVLGELHACLSSLDLIFLNWTTGTEASLRDMVNAGIGTPRMVPLFPPGWRRNTGRFVPTTVGAGERLIGFARGPVDGRDRVDPAVSITFTDADGVVTARTRDGRRWRIPELLGVLMSMVAADAFKIGLEGPHTPRLAVDGMVLFRETWRLPVASLGLSERATNRQRDYAEVRRWATGHGLPDQVFVKFPEETKPALFDLTSPTLVIAFVNLVRAARRRDPATVLNISEPLPDPRRSWLPDSTGGRYVSELRIQLSREVRA
ncbi:lantibiotic dehydratase [Micromonospora rifamycinica]|uniref:lantibiotic dehydratase n=1 Tax=Micromonospora rifamycinica TaxID=291594 RepID=UPI003419B793